MGDSSSAAWVHWHFSQLPLLILRRNLEGVATMMSALYFFRNMTRQRNGGQRVLRELPFQRQIAEIKTSVWLVSNL